MPVTGQDSVNRRPRCERELLQTVLVLSRDRLGQVARSRRSVSVIDAVVFYLQMREFDPEPARESKKKLSFFFSLTLAL